MFTIVHHPNTVSYWPMTSHAIPYHPSGPSVGASFTSCSDISLRRQSLDITLDLSTWYPATSIDFIMMFPLRMALFCGIPCSDSKSQQIYQNVGWFRSYIQWYPRSKSIFPFDPHSEKLCQLSGWGRLERCLLSGSWDCGLAEKAEKPGPQGRGIHPTVEPWKNLM